MDRAHRRGMDIYLLYHFKVIYRIDEIGTVTEIGMGFNEFPWTPDLEFGPDGAMYVSDPGNNVICRIVPEVSFTVDINIYPKTLSFKSKGKKNISGIMLPEEYDPHEIARDSLELSIPTCSDCEVIYPTCGFPLRQRYLAFFPRQDLIDEIETIDLDLPTELDLKITGELDDGTPFEGLDTIRVINKRKK